MLELTLESCPLYYSNMHTWNHSCQVLIEIVMGRVEDSDIRASIVLPDVVGDEEELTNDWDDI